MTLTVYEALTAKKLGQDYEANGIRFIRYIHNDLTVGEAAKIFSKVKDINCLEEMSLNKEINFTE